MVLTRAQPEQGSVEADTEHNHERAAALVFAVAVAAAVPVIMYLNRNQWFFHDEWDFLAQRDIRSVDDLFRPHNEHWTTIPIVLYRVLFRLVGLHHYWPYQLLAVGSHLAAAVLLCVIMRRAGVNAWLATAAATLFAYFGTGRQDIARAFQVTFNGSLAFGLAAIVLADTGSRRFGRRDLLAILCGLGALMCSGIGVSMTVALGVAVLLGRGWKLAASYVVPLAGIYLAWYLAYGRVGVSAKDSTPSSIADLAWRITAATFGGLGQVPGVGWVLGAVLVVGSVLVVQARPLPALRATVGPIVGLLVGAIGFLAITGYGRPGFLAMVTGRYQHLLAAMVLPALALAASAIAARWRFALPALVLLLLVGLPGNIAKLGPDAKNRGTLGDPPTMLTMASLAETSPLPRNFRPLPRLDRPVSMGWLRDQRALGRIPDPPHDLQLRRDLQLQLALHGAPQAAPITCSPVADPRAPVRLVRNDTLQIASQGRPVTLVSPVRSGPAGRITLTPALGGVNRRVIPAELVIEVVGPEGLVAVEVCHPPS